MRSTPVYLAFLALAALMFLIGYNFGLVRSAVTSDQNPVTKGETFIRRDTVRVTDTVTEPVPVRVDF